MVRGIRAEPGSHPWASKSSRDAEDAATAEVRLEQAEELFVPIS